MDADAIFSHHLLFVALVLGLLFPAGLGIYRRFRLVYRRQNRRDLEAAHLRRQAEEQQHYYKNGKGLH